MHYNESNSFFFINATKIYQFKVKDSEDFSANNMNNAGLNGCVYEFPVDYRLFLLIDRTFDFSNISNIRKYLMKKHDLK